MAKQTYSKLAKFKAEERQRAVSANPALLNQLTPTELALLFPDYFRRGKPDVGGFREAISRETAEKQRLWQGSVDTRLDRQGGMLSRMRQEYGGVGSAAAAAGNANWDKKAPQVMQRLMRDLNLTKEQAAGIVGSLKPESGLSAIQERDPIRGRGGFGWAQWTGDRRVAFERFASSRGMSVTDDEANYQFLLQELRTSQSAELARLKTAKSASEAARIFTGSTREGIGFLRPGAEHYGPSMNAAERAMKLYSDTDTTSGDQKKGQTPQQAGSPTTPGAPAGDTTKQATQSDKTTGGMSFEVKSNYIVPKDNSLYDSRNAQQCATLSKAFNPAIGRSNTWKVVDGEIKPGVVVATKQYNNPGADRVHSGYHTGVALTAPNEKGDFLLLEQYNGSGGARTKWVNKDSYPIGNTGQATSFGLISSGGKVHDEVSQEALAYSQNVASPEQKQVIGTNSGTPNIGGESAPGVSGEVTQGPMGGATLGDAEQQSASLLHPVGMTSNLMGSPLNMMMGMMGGFGGMQSATPLGLITTAMGFIMPIIGTIAGERLTGEGMGDGSGRRRFRHRHIGHRQPHMSAKATTRSVPATPIDNTPIKHRENLGFASIKYESGGKGVESISTGQMSKRRKDPGGVSYGEHQISTPTMKSYIKSPEAKAYAERFAGLTPGTPAFNKVYSQIAKEDPKGFAKSHQDFITRTHYEPVYRHAKALGYNVDDPRVQEALYSISVQHAGAKKVVSMATSSMGSTPESQVNALFGSRRQYVASKKMNFDTRYRDEQRTIAAIDPKKFDTGTTQFAAASPMATTGAVGPGVTTPGQPTGATTQMAAAPMSAGEKIFKSIVGSKTSTAAPANVTTPTNRNATDVTPSTTAIAPSSTRIEATPAPTTRFGREARNSVGMYSRPSMTNMYYQFSEGKNMSASVTPQTNVPVTPSSTTPVVGTPSALSAPGPAPDMNTIQMNQMKNQIAVAASQQQSTPTVVQQRTMDQAPSQGFNPDHAMKQIAQPYNTPSFHRAVTRAFGNETPGEVGQNHFNYGNSR